LGSAGGREIELLRLDQFVNGFVNLQFVKGAFSTQTGDGGWSGTY
jgi:hypothetical protein